MIITGSDLAAEIVRIGSTGPGSTLPRSLVYPGSISFSFVIRGSCENCTERDNLYRRGLSWRMMLLGTRVREKDTQTFTRCATYRMLDIRVRSCRAISI